MSAAGDKLGTSVNTVTNITPIMPVENTIAGSMSDLPGTSRGSGATGTVVVAPGIPAIKKWLAESILAGECIDLAELPPAKGRGKNLSGTLEGQVVLLHAVDYFQAKRLIPDLATWLQCFALYVAIIVTKHPERTTSLLMYMASIAKLSQKFKWPSWVIYDHSYRQDAAENNKTDWSKVDAGLHAQCFNGMAKSAEGWCRYCHSIDHISDSCPVKPMEQSKRRLPNPSTPPPKCWASPAGPPICKKYNKYNGDCNFGSSCKFLHICSRCKAPIQYQSAPRPWTHLSRWEGSTIWLACRDC